jgi:hypothetical protein
MKVKLFQFINSIATIKNKKVIIFSIVSVIWAAASLIFLFNLYHLFLDTGMITHHLLLLYSILSFIYGLAISIFFLINSLTPHRRKEDKLFGPPPDPWK